ncbi:unnamed protein product [Ectocarpus sp. 8 AP-2014]
MYKYSCTCRNPLLLMLGGRLKGSRGQGVESFRQQTRETRRNAKANMAEKRRTSNGTRVKKRSESCRGWVMPWKHRRRTHTRASKIEIWRSRHENARPPPPTSTHTHTEAYVRSSTN